jgi:tetratricopeptide (TPR) repeat protein
MVAVLLFALLTPSADAARTHFAKGQKLFVDQRYKEALSEFEAAQKAAPHEVADLYFNIGQCNRNLGRVRPAIAAFERYLELKPDAPDRKQVRQMLSKLRAKLPPDNDDPPADSEPSLAQVIASDLDSKAATVEPAAAVEPAPAAEPAPAPVKLELPRESAPEPTQIAMATQEPPAASSHLYEKWWFWAGIGVTVLGTTAGLYAGFHHGSSPTMTPAEMLGSAGTFDTRGGH